VRLVFRPPSPLGAPHRLAPSPLARCGAFLRPRRGTAVLFGEPIMGKDVEPRRSRDSSRWRDRMICTSVRSTRRCRRCYTQRDRRCYTHNLGPNSRHNSGRRNSSPGSDWRWLRLLAPPLPGLRRRPQRHTPVTVPIAAMPVACVTMTNTRMTHRVNALR
jgi:hypothetical protein